MSSRRTWIALFAAAGGSIGLLWLPCESPRDVWCVPLGVPGEWTWNRIPVDDGEVLHLLLGWLLAAVAFLAYGTVIWLGTHRINCCSRREAVAWLAGLVLVGFFWLSVLQESPPDGYRTSKAAHVLYYPGSSGYFTVARYAISDVPSFLSGYEARMSAGDVLHVGTHPPGLFLFHRGLTQLCHRYPSLAEATVASQPESVATALSLIARQTQHSQTPLLARDRAALWMAALVTQAVGALAIVPLYLLLRRTYSRPVSWMAASLWPLVPGLAIFLPKSDALYPLIGLAFLYCWLEGCRKRSFLLCAAAGLLFWLGMFLSLALLPVGYATVLCLAGAGAVVVVTGLAGQPPGVITPMHSHLWWLLFCPGLLSLFYSRALCADPGRRVGTWLRSWTAVVVVGSLSDLLSNFGTFRGWSDLSGPFWLGAIGGLVLALLGYLTLRRSLGTESTPYRSMSPARQW
ncbi:MAG: hypothetical protein IH939_08230 [Acidobacteria bacterium]|nr:hypothetical protein [Acidobacteriota bacterium]